VAEVIPDGFRVEVRLVPDEQTTPTDPPAEAVTLAQVQAMVAGLASVEDLLTSCVPIPMGGQVAASMSVPLLVPPFPLEVASVELVVWGGPTVAAHPSSFWTVELRAMNPLGVPRALVRRTTCTTALSSPVAVPAGASIEARRPWSMNAEEWVSRDVAAGETLHLAFVAAGTPPPVVGAVAVTLGYRPL
jgi:hypothetical protein